MQCIENCDDVSAANRVYYSQPVWQTLQMFMGEAWCLAIYGLSTMRQKYRDKQASNNGDQREREVLLIYLILRRNPRTAPISRILH